MFFQKDAAREQTHKDHQPSIFLIKSDQKRHAEDQDHLQTQIPPGIYLHLRSEQMAHSQEIQKHTDKIHKKSVFVTGHMQHISDSRTEYKRDRK